MNVNLTESVDGSRSVFEYDFTLSANAVAMRTAETELSAMRLIQAMK